MCNGLAKQNISLFFEKVANRGLNNEKIDSQESVSSFKLKQYKMIEELRHILDLESQSTNELKIISGCDTPYNSIKHLILPLKEAYNTNPTEKIIKLRAIRKQFEILSAFRSTAYSNDQNSTVQFRHNSRPPTVPTNLSELAPTERFRKRGSETNKKIAMSPYFDAQLRVVKRFSKLGRAPFTSSHKTRSALSPNRTSTVEHPLFSQTPY